MRSLLILFAALSLCMARPQNGGLHVSPIKSVGSYVIGGTDASPGEFPWQLSQTRSGSHSCGASLLSSSYALSAAHCVDGAVPSTIQVIAGLHNRNDLSGTQTVGITDYTIHSQYQVGSVSYANDIAILDFAQQISIGGNIEAAILSADDGTNFAGSICTISGWGRTDGTNNLPITLQKASITVLSTAQCEDALTGIIGANVWENQICVQDTAELRGACNGDSGGPLNCPDAPNIVVAGVASWVITSGGDECLPTYPSVYTRVSGYLGWIDINTP